MVTGIIDVGGGYRDIFGAGVLDGLLKSSLIAVTVFLLAVEISPRF